MAQAKKKSSDSREASKKRAPIGLVTVLAAAGGVVIGSAGTYFFSKPTAAPAQTGSSAAADPTQTQLISLPNTSPQPQYTPAPQPPGEVPPGKVWSVEHGHWHDVAPAAPPTSAETPEAKVVPAPTAVPAATKD